MSKTFYTILNFIILAAVLGAALYLVHEKYREISRPCALPLHYAIGDVDERFGLSAPDVLRALADAESLWEDAVGDDIYQYTSDATLKIHFRFDQRQQETLKIKEFQGDFSQKDLEYNQMKEEVDVLKKKYEKASANYDDRLRTYQSDLEDYNHELEKINDAGGASKKDLKDLEKKREVIDEKAKDLENQRQEVNKVVTLQREQVSKLNDFAETLNVQVQDFNQTYGEPKIFDQGRFDGREIVIYQYTEYDDLVLVLAHELGHARGLDHVSDKEAIMHEIFHGDSNKQNSVTSQDKAELQKACNPEVKFF